MKPTNGINKVIRVFKTTIKHCWGSCLVYAVILSLVTALSFAISIIYKYLVNELSVGVNMGTVTSVFIGLIILYLVLYFVNMASGFLTVFGQNFFRYKADECFLQLFMDKSNNTPQVRFLQSEFYDQYIFIGNNVHKISAYLSDIIQLCFSDIVYASWYLHESRSIGKRWCRVVQRSVAKIGYCKITSR